MRDQAIERAYLARLHDETRALAARCVESDARGWIAQSIEVCPGLYALLAAMDKRRVDRVVNRTVAAIAAGDRLSAVIRSTLVDWARGVVPSATAGEVSRLVERALPLVRRAGPRVAPEFFSRAPPESVSVGDIPRDPFENRVWYSVVAALSDHEGHAAGNDLRCAALGQFASAQAEALMEACFLFVTLPSDVFSACVAAGFTPGRRSNAVDLLSRCKRSQIGAITRDAASMIFPPPPLPDRVSTASQIVALRSAPALAEHAASMGHCAFDVYAADVCDGESFLYELRSGCGRATIRLARSEWGWALAEGAGERNRPLEPREVALVEEWFREHAVAATWPHE